MFSVIPAVSTTVVFTPAPTATVTATVGVKQLVIAEISTVTLITQSVPGFATQTIEQFGISRFELSNVSYGIVVFLLDLYHFRNHHGLYHCVSNGHWDYHSLL
jgi:hypothetical protein